MVACLQPAFKLFISAGKTEKTAHLRKKQAYLEYIKAIQESQTMPNQKEAAWKRTAAMARIELFGSREVLEQLETVSKIHNTDSTVPLKKLFKAMRNDLNVT